LNALTTYADALAAASCADSAAQAARVAATTAAVARLRGAAAARGCRLTAADKASIGGALAAADHTKLCVAAAAAPPRKTGAAAGGPYPVGALVQTLPSSNDHVVRPPVCCPKFESHARACCTSECRVMASLYSAWFSLSMCCRLPSNVVPAHQQCPTSQVYEVAP